MAFKVETADNRSSLWVGKAGLPPL